MRNKILLAATLCALLFGASPVIFADSAWLTGTTDQKLDTLANIQPGLGTVMIEYGNRFGNVYYAAKAKNWGMAAYQLKELVEIQEVAETTRPKRVELLKKFEDSNLKPLANDIVSQDWANFQKDFDKTAKSCNACHAGTGFAFIQYSLPAAPAAPTKMETTLTFTRTQLEGLLSALVGN